MRRLTFDAPLPWTSESLYNWTIHSITGIRFRSDIQFSMCCEPANVLGIQTGVAIAHPELPVNPILPLSFIELVTHEARHNNGFGHSCGNNDQTVSEMGA